MTPSSAGPTARLWSPRDVAIVSFLLGSPGGLAVAARDLHRMGHHLLGWVHLLAAPALVLAIMLLPDVPSGLALLLNVGLAAYLYWVLRRQIGSFERSGGHVERASGAAGLATYAGGWAIALVPLIAIVFLGAQVQNILAGTVEFGTAGSGCSVEARATSIPADEPIHYVAYLARAVEAGETVDLSVTEAAAGAVGSDSLALDSRADCVDGTIPGGTLPAGTYTFRFTTGSEQLASGQLTVRAP